MPRNGPGNTLRPNDYCTIAQATEIAIRVTRQEIIRAAGLDPEKPTFRRYIDAPAFADALCVIEHVAVEAARQQRLDRRIRRWWRRLYSKLQVRQ